MHDAIMTKEEEAVIKTKITRQRPGNVQMQRTGGGCADGENGRGYAHEPAPTLRPPWAAEMSRLAPSTRPLSRNNAVGQPGKHSRLQDTHTVVCKTEGLYSLMWTDLWYGHVQPFQIM